MISLITRVMAHWAWWLQFWCALTDAQWSRKRLTEPSPVTIACTNKANQLPPTLWLRSMLGREDSPIVQSWTTRPSWIASLMLSKRWVEPSLSYAPTRQANLHQPCGFDLRLHERTLPQCKVGGSSLMRSRCVEPPLSYIPIRQANIRQHCSFNLWLDERYQDLRSSG